MKKHKKIVTIITIIVLTILLLPTFSSATKDPIKNPNAFKPGSISSSDVTVVKNKVNPIIGTLVTVGVIVSVVTVAILGIKYMVGSVEERAEYKKSMVPYIIGAVFLFSASSIVGIIANLAKDIIK